eukprot:24907_1
MMIEQGYGATAYDQTGLTWEKSWMETNNLMNCASANWDSRRRRLSRTRRRLMVEPQVDPSLTFTEPCPPGSQSEIDAIAACDQSLTDHQTCYDEYDAIANGEELKQDCVFDVCALSQAERGTINERTPLEIAEDIFGQPLEDKCNIPDID